GAGWYEHQYNPATGPRWLWMSQHGLLVVHVRVARCSFRQASCRQYFSGPSQLVIHRASHAAERPLSSDLSLTISISAVLIAEEELRSRWKPTKSSSRANTTSGRTTGGTSGSSSSGGSCARRTDVR